MIFKDRAFPHPVLVPFRDDVAPNHFGLQVKVSSDADSYYIDVSFDYENSTLSALIGTGAAVHAVHLECKRNFYREMFCFKDRSHRLSIRASEFVGRVEVCGFISAQETIESYRIVGSHADYGNAAFKIVPGDILALAPAQTFDAFVDYDPLKNISSILTIRRSETIEEGSMSLDTNDDRIVVTLSQRDYDRYTDLKADPALGPLLSNQVVVPALLEAVHEIRDTPDDSFEIEMHKRWFRSIYKKLDDSGTNIRNKTVTPIEAVQTLLRFPLRRSLEGLIQMNPLDEQA